MEPLAGKEPAAGVTSVSQGRLAVSISSGIFRLASVSGATAAENHLAAPAAPMLVAVPLAHATGLSPPPLAMAASRVTCSSISGSSF